MRDGRWSMGSRRDRSQRPDPANEGKTMKDAAAAWNEAKTKRGDLEYRPAGED